MRFLQFITAALLPFAALAAKESSGDRFANYRAQQLANAGTLKLDDKAYDELTRAPRDFAVAVLLTAMDTRFGCALCREFQPEWELLAKQWSKGDKEGKSKVVHATLDFIDGKATFQALQLQTAPVLMFFPPTTGPHGKPDAQISRFDFGAGISKAEPVYAWISRNLPDQTHPPFVRPINYVKVTITTTALLGVVTFFTVAAPYVYPIIQNRNLWAAISLIAVLLFTSGQMFNYIRNVPYVASDNRGGVSYFAGGFQNQLGIETQMVAAMYGVLAFATISLALKVPRMADPRAQSVAVLVWGGVLLGMYSFLLSVFRVKNGGYPFWLPPF